MKRPVFLFLAIAFLFSLNSCVEPERRPYSPYSDTRLTIQERIDNQQRRIDTGIQSGELTRAEADTLNDNLARIRQDYARASRDGWISDEENSRLDQYLDLNSRMIQDKRNNQVRRLYSEPDQQRSDFRNRIEKQQKRIDQGVASGDLTRREADMLQDNLNHIKDEYNRMKADGRLTRPEAERLERDLDLNSKMIYDRRNNQIKRLYSAPEPSPARKQEKPISFQARIDQQQKRIDQGRASGELTRKEADVVQDNLDRIKALYARMKADGRLTEKEQEKLDNKLDQNDRMIYNKKHNPIERFDRFD